MPSSHAQFLAFFSIYLTLFLLRRHQPPAPEHNRLLLAKGNLHFLIPSPHTQRIFLSIYVLGMGALVSFSRIYLNYHTPKQVLAGCSAGIVSALAWFGVTSWFRSEGWLHWALDAEVSRWLRIRDLVVEEDLAEAGWREWDRQRLARQRGRKRK